MGIIKEEKKLMIIENFLPNLENFVEDIYKINLFEKNTFNEKYNTKDSWSGLRSGPLSTENKFLFFLILQNLNKVCFLKKYSLDMYVHLRTEKSNNIIHTDPVDFSFLIYLNKTNLNSGTYLYDNKGEIISDVKYVQNRFVIFSGSYPHMGYGHLEKSSEDGRLTINGFLTTL